MTEPSSPVVAPSVHGRIVIRAGRLLDVVSGEVLADRDLIVEGGRIVGIEGAGASSPTTAPCPRPSPRPPSTSPA